MSATARERADALVHGAGTGGDVAVLEPNDTTPQARCVDLGGESRRPSLELLRPHAAPLIAALVRVSRAPSLTRAVLSTN